MPLLTSIVCSYTAEDDVGLRTASCEVLNQNYEVVKQKLDLAVPSAVFTFDDLTAGQDYYVKMYVVDTSENVTTREEYVSIVDFTPPTINLFTTTSQTGTHHRRRQRHRQFEWRCILLRLTLLDFRPRHRARLLLY